MLPVSGYRVLPATCISYDVVCSSDFEDMVLFVLRLHSVVIYGGIELKSEERSLRSLLNSPCCFPHNLTFGLLTQRDKTRREAVPLDGVATYKDNLQLDRTTPVGRKRSSFYFIERRLDSKAEPRSGGGADKSITLQGKRKRVNQTLETEP